MAQATDVTTAQISRSGSTLGASDSRTESPVSKIANQKQSGAVFTIVSKPENVEQWLYECGFRGSEGSVDYRALKEHIDARIQRALAKAVDADIIKGAAVEPFLATTKILRRAVKFHKSAYGQSREFESILAHFINIAGNEKAREIHGEAWEARTTRQSFGVPKPKPTTNSKQRLSIKAHKNFIEKLPPYLQHPGAIACAIGIDGRERSMQLAELVRNVRWAYEEDVATGKPVPSRKFKALADLMGCRPEDLVSLDMWQESKDIVPPWPKQWLGEEKLTTKGRSGQRVITPERITSSRPTEPTTAVEPSFAVSREVAENLLRAYTGLAEDIMRSVDSTLLHTTLDAIDQDDGINVALAKPEARVWLSITDARSHRDRVLQELVKAAGIEIAASVAAEALLAFVADPRKGIVMQLLLCTKDEITACSKAIGEILIPSRTGAQVRLMCNKLVDHVARKLQYSPTAG